MSKDLDFHPQGWHGDKTAAKCCKMAQKIPEVEANIYKTLIKSKCDHPGKGEENHQCCGAITITENHILLRCKKCGDAKGVF